MNQLSKKHIISIGSVAIIIAIVFFFIGMVFAKGASVKKQMKPGMMQERMNGAQNMRKNAGNSAVGTILSTDATSITLKNRDGGSKIILMSPSTSILKTAPGTLSDLSPETTIMVNGTANADGSISATTISIRPIESMETKKP